MLISEFIESKKLTQQQFAGMVGVSQGLIWQWINGRQKVTAERAIQIERATDGAINRHDLRPDLFHAQAAA